MLAVFTLLPLASAILASVVWRPIFLTGRYAVIVLPAFVLLLAIGAAALWQAAAVFGRLAYATLLGSFVALAVAGLSSYYDAPASRIEERIAASIAQDLRPDDLVITTGLLRAPVEYYLRQLSTVGAATLQSFPTSTDRHPGWFDFNVTKRNAMKDLAELKREAVPHDRIFVADHTASTTFYRLSADLHRTLIAEFGSQPTVVFAAGEEVAGVPQFVVLRYQRSAASGPPAD
jgi:hypothetical protein